MPKNDTDPDEVNIRPFADVLLDLNAGRTHNELSEALHELTQAVKDTGRKGTLTLTIQVAQMKNTGGTLVVSDRVAVKKPQADRVDSIFFTDSDGNLSRKDPRQLTLPEPERPESPAAEVETPTSGDSNVTHIERASRA